MFERFTDRARHAVVLAQEEARLLGHDYIGTEHLLLGLLRASDGVAAQSLDSLGVSLDAARAKIQELVGPGETAPGGHIPFTPRSKKVLELSLREALQLGHNYIGTEHVLLGLLREGEGVAVQALRQLGHEPPAVRHRVIEMAASGPAEQVPERRGRAAARPPAAELPAGVLAVPGALPLGSVERPSLTRVVPLAQDVSLPEGERLVLVSLELWSSWMILRSALMAKPGSTLAHAPELVLSFLLSDAAGTHYELSAAATSGVSAFRFHQAVFQPEPPAGTEALDLTVFGARDKELATARIDLGGGAAEGVG